MRLKGITVTLIDKQEVGKDPFGSPMYKDLQIEVENVLVAPVSAEDNINNLELYGKRAEYVLAIPKGDNNIWEDKEIIFFDRRFKAFGPVVQGIEELIPLGWNKKVKVESFEKV